MKNKYRILSLVMACLISFYIAGCGSDDSDEPDNNSPTVDTLVVPTEFNPGETLEFSVIAYDKDGDPLTYTWTVSAGKLSTTTGVSVKWTAPSDIESASVAVTVIVSDGFSKSTKRVKKIANLKFVPPDPIEEIVPDPPQINLIVPGRSAAGIKLGDPFKNVRELYGEPDDPLGVDRWFSYWENPNRGISGRVDGIGLVEHIFVRRPNKAKTAGRRGIGNTLKQVEEEFGNAEREDPLKAGVKTHWYWKRGISFDFNVDDKVTMIFIFKPHAAAPGVAGAPSQHQQQMRNAAIEDLYRRKL
ncbi:hypothetical protein C6501_13080 [Candidatus Poribacteria bacterium]|nr:MAG: hypothetical protein C6501_13080 [Candidatus Poribacteria bacterium]